MSEMLWISRGFEVQPRKRRRCTVEDLEQGILQLSLSGQTEEVELDVLLQTLTLQAPSTHPAFSSDASCGEVGRTGVDCSSAANDCAAAGAAAARHVAVCCSQLVPLRSERRRRRIPRFTPLPKPMPCISPAANYVLKFGGASFMLSEAVCHQLAWVQRQYKRARDARTADEDDTAQASAATVVYSKPRKIDLALDFQALRL
eukprot:gb/GFBE01004492.1/.p1 GENE.gb/GFBE01004492.1/~~gb/GFBE01004492.1/.p1  ORF type:complete len:202 (+),score=39.98 gb/GFBE01004492.1/:1-606(+)